MPLEKKNSNYVLKIVCKVAMIDVLKGLPASSMINIIFFYIELSTLTPIAVCHVTCPYIQSLQELGRMLKGA